MAGLPSVAGAVAAAGQKAAKSASKAGPEPKPPKLEDIYSCEPTRWYGVYPYGFKYNDPNGESWYLYLPINPSDLQITTHFATNVVTTLYGVVEEHSEVRYYDIVIQGTTGYAPKRTGIWGFKDGAAGTTTPSPAKNYINEKSPVHPKSGTVDDPLNSRTSFTPGATLHAGGFFQQTMAAVNQVMAAGKDLLNSVKKGGHATAAPSSFATGVNLASSGYVAFHTMYRFLLHYKKDMASAGNDKTKRKEHPLQFVCFKDGVKYDCVPRTFTLTRSASSPMLYNYTIVLRAYNLQPSSSYKLPNSKLQELGLDGVKGSAFARMQKVAGKAKSLAGAAMAAIGAAGR